ncbi:hypothetical protein [Hamadaea tsunoensis]|uniref:hypothetical protein n=1 Tax=Hamadaea tsunoensis TaxID=53368 RepID=UPI0004097B7B|nr:hypothetical protein [Hamadaea tsunoensis]
MKWILGLYPAWWRERYAAEMSALLEELPLEGRSARRRVRLAADLIRGALDARIALAPEPEASEVETGMTVPSNGSAVPAKSTAVPAKRTVGLVLIPALVVWAALSLDIVLTNVVFPSTTDDDTVSVLGAYIAVFAVLAGIGYLAVRRGGALKTAALCGAIAGAVIGLLTIGTFLAVDNIWLDIVSRQPQKIQALADSGGGSMRASINRGLLGALVGMPILLGAFGTVFSVIGGAIGLRGRSPSV